MECGISMHGHAQSICRSLNKDYNGAFSEWVWYFFFFSGKVPNFLKNLIIFKINIIYKKKASF